MTIKKVALYLRKSRLDLSNETREETLARHERMLKDFCKRNNLTVVKIYKEVVSGENLEDRPEAQALLDAVANGEFDGVVVVELERLSRGNQIDQVEVAETFKNSNTLIYTLNKTYDLSSGNEYDEDFFEFGLFMSRREYNSIKRRLIRGKKQAQKEGYFIGSALPYGFGKVRGDRGFVLVPNDETQIVQMIFNKFVNEHYSLADLLHYLNKNGIKPARANLWSKVALKNLLKNKTYIGYIYFDANKKRSQDCCYKGKHQAIISEELFYKAQDKLAVTSHKSKYGTQLSNPLASLVFCSKCGYTMAKHEEYLRCNRYGCPTISSTFERVEKRIIEELKNELTGFNYFIENYGDEIEKENTSKQNEIKIIKRQIAKKEQMLNKACEMLELGVYSLDKYLERSSTITKEKEALQLQLDAVDNAPLKNVVRVKKAIPILEKCLDEYWELDVQARNDMLKAIIQKVEYSKTKRNKKGSTADNMELKIYLKI